MSIFQLYIITQTTYFLAIPILFHYLPKTLFFFDLIYTTRTKLIFWLNWIFKKLQKIVDSINFLSLSINPYQLLNFILLFSNQERFYFSFHLLTHISPTHLFGYHASGINSFLISFLNTLHCLNLLGQTKSLIWIKVSGSSSSKLSSTRLILLGIWY